MIVQWLIRFYAVMLYCYPRSFRAEFAEEMLAVFAQAAEDAAARGGLAFGLFCLKELAGFPAAIGRAYREATGGATGEAAGDRQINAATPGENNPLEQSWRELLLALAVFLLPAWIILVNQSPESSFSFGLKKALLFLGVMAVVGWLCGVPLWSVPYIGMVLVIAGYLYLFHWVASLASPALISDFSPGRLDPRTYLLLEIASTGMLWLMLFCLTLLIVALLAVFDRFQTLLRRVHHDWTLLSYILYGESVFALLLLFNSQHTRPNYEIASLFCLVGGVWFYVHSPARWQRLLALAGCLTLAVGAAALGSWEGITAIEWSSLRGIQASQGWRLLFSWMWMMVALALPGLLSRLPAAQPKGPSAGSPPGGRLSSV